MPTSIHRHYNRGNGRRFMLIYASSCEGVAHRKQADLQAHHGRM